MTDELRNRARWEYRFEHYRNAFLLLREGCDAYRRREFSELEKEGLVARFSFTWELGWKLLKDYLRYLGTTLEVIAPKPVIRAALSAGLIADSSTWMDVLDTRNGLAHVYSCELRDAALTLIRDTYLKIFQALYNDFAKRFDAARTD